MSFNTHYYCVVFTYFFNSSVVQVELLNFLYGCLGNRNAAFTLIERVFSQTSPVICIRTSGSSCIFNDYTYLSNSDWMLMAVTKATFDPLSRRNVCDSLFSDRQIISEFLDHCTWTRVCIPYQRTRVLPLELLGTNIQILACAYWHSRTALIFQGPSILPNVLQDDMR